MLTAPMTVVRFDVFSGHVLATAVNMKFIVKYVGIALNRLDIISHTWVWSITKFSLPPMLATSYHCFHENFGQVFVRARVKMIHNSWLICHCVPVSTYYDYHTWMGTNIIYFVYRIYNVVVVLLLLARLLPCRFAPFPTFLGKAGEWCVACAGAKGSDNMGPFCTNYSM